MSKKPIPRVNPLELKRTKMKAAINDAISAFKTEYGASDTQQVVLAQLRRINAIEDQKRRRSAETGS